MRFIVVFGVVAALSLGVADLAYANGDQVKQYICQPVKETSASYPIICPVLQGQIIDEQCACDPGFVMVDPDTSPAATETESVSGR